MAERKHRARRPARAGRPARPAKVTAPLSAAVLRTERRRRSRGPRILVITGLSGSGKTHAARALEDAGWFCVDNLPSALIPRFAELIRGSVELSRSALVVDMRERDFVKQFPHVFRQLRARGFDVRLLFLEADEKALVRRFSETRRPHPLAINQPAIEGIREEREALRPIRKMADLILDTSELNVHELREYLREHYDVRAQAPPIVIGVTSFGYKFGVPSEADLVFDCRFLPNPNFIPSLKPQTGNQPAVVRYLKRQPETAAFLKRLRSFLSYLIPRYIREGKSYLTIGIGCTGGRHRSVMIANELAASLRGNGYPLRVRHRDLRQEASPLSPTVDSLRRRRLMKRDAERGRR
jgi:RNase adapter protein RapZ